MSRGRGMVPWAECALMAIGLISLGWYGLSTLAAARVQSAARATLARPAAAGARASAPLDVGMPLVPAWRSALIGKMDIPRLDVSVAVLEGEDATTLRVAAGHLPGSALPGEPGNSAIAGHRDTFFRRLQEVRIDDEIRIDTPRGTFRYRVARTLVVDPEDTWVLDEWDTPTLTLITCFPFSALGRAPRRFVVVAREAAAETVEIP